MNEIFKTKNKKKSLSATSLVLISTHHCAFKYFYLYGVPGWLSLLSVWRLILAQVMISWFVGWSLESGYMLTVWSLLGILSLPPCIFQTKCINIENISVYLSISLLSMTTKVKHDCYKYGKVTEPNQWETQEPHLNWRTLQKISDRYSSKLPKPSKTEKAWETVTAQRSQKIYNN